MLYIKFSEAGKAIQTGYSHDVCVSSEWACRWDWKSLEQVEKIAAELSEALGEKYIGIEKSSTPRFDVIKAPAVGDKVSKAFNGDYYPDGEIAKISKTLSIITTTTGTTYRRYRNSGAWIAAKTWAMANGHRAELNPHF